MKWLAGIAITASLIVIPVLAYGENAPIDAKADVQKLAGQWLTVTRVTPRGSSDVRTSQLTNFEHGMGSLSDDVLKEKAPARGKLGIKIAMSVADGEGRDLTDGRRG